jgi:release factor glutamine methyltransferase
MTLDQWLQGATAILQNSGIDTARLDAVVLLEDVIGTDRAYLLAQPDVVLDDRIVTQLDGLIERRASHEPLAYIRGKSEFYGREFIVNNYVLVPRPETETMIDLFKTKITELESRPETTLRIADIGTGSGALAITAKLELQEVEVFATDVDPSAIKVAKANAEKLWARMTFLEGDLLEPLQSVGAQLSALLANLPYVPDDYQINQAASFEPSFAIFGGPDGLDQYRRMFDQINLLEAQPIYIFTEAMPDQHPVLASLATSHGYTTVATEGFIQVFRL